jgi:hypothetical protein
MALISEWMEQCGKKVLDNAGIVREAKKKILGVSTLLCKRPGFVFGMGARGKGQHPFPRPAM